MIFRKVALERLSSPEQLDQLMQVTSPRGWLALGAVGALLVACLFWGVYGSIPTTADGEGILIRRGGVSSLVANASGQVEDLLVAVGDVVEKGQPVARIRQEPLLRQLEEVRSKRADLAREYGDLLRYAGEQRSLKSRELAQQRSNLERSIQALERDVQILRERLAEEEKLLAEGLITKQALLDTEQRLNEAHNRLAAERLELSGLALTRLESEQQLDEQVEARQNAIRDLDLEVRELEAKLAEEVDIVAARDGRVLELLVDRGDVVVPGTQVLNLEVVSEELVAVIFVPAETGKQVRPGMPARVAPSTVKREEYGFMLGEVTWVAAFPSTSRGMTRLLGNAELVTRLMQQGPPIQVNVRLHRDPSTPTGYRWSSSGGPNLEISSGTLAAGSVIVREDRPISLLIPRVREKLGV